MRILTWEGKLAHTSWSMFRQRSSPRYIQLMGDIAPTIITRVVREMAADEPLSKDYDFSALSIEQHKQRAYSATLNALKGLVANSEVRQLNRGFTATQNARAIPRTISRARQ